MTKIGRNDPCPCGSGKKFKKCCLGKVFDYELGDNGELYQKFPINDEMYEVLKRQEEQFIQCFEREPGEGDPVFLQKYIYSDDEYDSAIVRAMEKAGCDPAHIYAYSKTGRLIFQSTLKNATGAHIEEWEDAVDEYYALKEESNIQTNSYRDFSELTNDLKSELRNCIYVFGFVLDKHINLNRQDGSILEELTLDKEHMNFCITKTIKTLRGIRILLDSFLSDEALILCRSIYENFLHIAFIKKHPEKADDLVKAKIGLQTGTHEYKKTSKGKSDKRIIVERNQCTGLLRERKNYLTFKYT